MSLKSESMRFSAAERDYLPWLGKTGKLAMGWSCWINRDMAEAMESVFEGIATTRVRILTHWAEEQWHILSGLSEQAAGMFPDIPLSLLHSTLESNDDFSEIFLISPRGEVLLSTYAQREKGSHIRENVREFLNVQNARFLHGPYLDPLTERIGPSSSQFHDEVTLMFYQPLTVGGNVAGYVCGRVPNDVVGDLIQREAGHVFVESGDNYLFMVESRFDAAIKPGTALSRSRFEDGSFTFGDNLKSGVATAHWGVVKVDKHTELELMFNDPATGSLHPGVRETIATGSNMFVTYPGYPDYRHVPVVGKGIGFRMPGSPDTWGMMCEGDLEEVYRRRSIALKLGSSFWGLAVALVTMQFGLNYIPGLSRLASYGLMLAAISALCLLFCRRRLAGVAGRLDEIGDIARNIVERGGDLTITLDRKNLLYDEAGDLGKWLNSLIDSFDGILRKIAAASRRAQESNVKLGEKAAGASAVADGVSEKNKQILEALHSYVELSSSSTERIKTNLVEIVESVQEQFRSIQGRLDGIRSKVNVTEDVIARLNKISGKIGSIVKVIDDIAEQANLLALNAAIEAARAGDQGRGFAVVADEVRKLAENTTKETKTIQEMVSGIKKESEEAAVSMKASIDEVETSVKIVGQAEKDVAGMTESEARNGKESVFAQILRVLSEISALSQKNSAMAQEVETSVGQMKTSISEVMADSKQVINAANKLLQLVSQFKLSR